MKQFLKNSALLFLPLVLWAIFILVVDPFQYFDFNAKNKTHKKNKIAKQLNALLYRSIDFKNQPGPYVIIGDSRSNALPDQTIFKLTHKHYKRLNTNSAKLNEMIDMFYFAHKQIPLKHVVMGINFSMFNAYSYGNRFKSVEEILDNPLKYIYNRSIAEVAFYTVFSSVNSNNIEQQTQHNKAALWNLFITQKGKDWYGKYAHPKQVENRFTQMINFAKRNNIKITLMVTPHQQGFTNQIVKYGLAKEAQSFKNYLANLNATVVDFDFANEITKWPSNFIDPIHYNDSIGQILATEIFTEKYFFGKPL